MNHAETTFSSTNASAHSSAQQSLASLTLGAIGVVYGDIGTSPLYTMREAFNGVHGVTPSPDNVLGVLSLVFWALLVIVSIKYVIFMMRVDNRGEGGIVALMALTLRTTHPKQRRRWILMAMGLFGVALFYGDGVITPAISVLSAVEGLEVALPALEPYVIPVTVGVLVALFLFQRQGTATVSLFFAPVICIWFATLAMLGLSAIIREPSVLQALNPLYGADFFLRHGGRGFLVLGAVVLAITGGEALYADMGHFGRRPIRLAWFLFVLPALLLNYFGQGALIIHDPTAVQSPFYLLVPTWGLYPMIVLATLATIIASQAVISGAYSITRQAIQLGYSPRLQIIHTSAQTIGQVYIPWINWMLLIAVISLVLGFQSSSNLAAAYGIAVTGTMFIDTVLAFVVIHSLWRWNWLRVAFIAAVFVTVDLSFLSANAIKILHGGWFPLVIGMALFTLMSTWKRGREILFERLSENVIALAPFLASITSDPPLRVPGTAVFLNASAEGVPHSVLHNLKHNKVLHERVVFLTVLTKEVPWVPEEQRLEVHRLAPDFYRILVRYGFMDEIDIPKALEQCRAFALEFNMQEASFFFSRETLLPTKRPGMALWREKIFVGLSRNESSAMMFFRIPTNRVVELGTQIEL
jgi:KUP system potassium uptake protein